MKIALPQELTKLMRNSANIELTTDSTIVNGRRESHFNQDTRQTLLDLLFIEMENTALKVRCVLFVGMAAFFMYKVERQAIYFIKMCLKSPWTVV